MQTEAEESEFWGEHELINDIKEIADDKSLPYKTLIRVWLTEKLKECK